MKLYIFRGFETYTYQTHTAFIATSISKAETLLNNLFDEIHSVAVKQADIEEKIDQIFSNHNTEKQDLEKEIKLLKDQVLTSKPPDKSVFDFHEQRNQIIGKTREYESNMNSIYHELCLKADLMRIVDYRPKAFDIYPESNKAEWVKGSLSHLLEIESDLIINDSVTNGD